MRKANSTARINPSSTREKKAWVPLNDLPELNESSQSKETFFSTATKSNFMGNNLDIADESFDHQKEGKAYRRMLMRNKSVSIITKEKDKFVDEMVTKVST